MIGRLTRALAATCVLVASATAAPFPPTEVTAERDTSGNLGCRVTHRAAALAIAEALREKQVPIATVEQIADFEAIEANVQLTAEYVADGCAVSVLFRFQSNQPVMVHAELGLRRVDLILCEKTGLLSGPLEELQPRVNKWLRSTVQECVSEVQREV